MKRIVILLMSLVTPLLFILAENNDPIGDCYEKLYRQKDSLNNIIQSLQADTTAKIKQIKALQEQTKEAGMANLYKRDIDSLKALLEGTIPRKQLDDSIKLYNNRMKDTISLHKENELILQKTIDSLNMQLKGLAEKVSEFSPKIDKYNGIINNLSSYYLTKTVTQLYNNTNLSHLLFAKDIYMQLEKPLPNEIRVAIACLEAQQLCGQKYNKVSIEQKIRMLLADNSQKSKEMTLRLQQYAPIYAEADSLWTAIQQEVCMEEITSNYAQLDSKLRIWQRTQKFLNKYPNLAHDYPYIYEELQKMLREIWKNANNFNKIPAPFR